MMYAIQCNEHPASNSKTVASFLRDTAAEVVGPEAAKVLVPDDYGLFYSVEEAQAAADRITAQHQADGLPCKFVVMPDVEVVS